MRNDSLDLKVSEPCQDVSEGLKFAYYIGQSIIYYRVISPP